MFLKKQRKYFRWAAAYLFILFLISFNTYPLAAQSAKTDNDQLQPLHSGVKLYDFTGNLRWETNYDAFFDPSGNRQVEKHSETTLSVQLRNIYLLDAYVGIGYRLLALAAMDDFFKGTVYGGVGGGPMVRIYPIQNLRWQPYLQGGFVAGYDLALNGFAQYNGVSYRTGLRAGLDYRFTNAFSLFLEIGPEWIYGQGLHLYLHKQHIHALNINIGIELLRF
jgi:hypothetical protein